MKKINYNFIKGYARLLGIGEDVPKFNSRGGLRTIIKPGGLKTTYRFLKYLEQKVKEKTNGDYDFVPQSFIEEVKRAQEALKEERKGNITHYSLEGKQTTESVGTLLDKYKNIFYISKDSDNKELAAYHSLFTVLPDFILQKNKLLILSPSTIKKIKRIGGFVPCRKIFLHKQLPMFFGRLKQANEVFSYGINKLRIRKVSEYYYNLYNKTYTKLNINGLFSSRLVKVKIETANEETKYITETINTNVYEYFHYEINKVAKINESLQMVIDELKKVSYPLLLLSNLYEYENFNIAISKSKSIIRTYKLTKLNQIYYGN